MSDQCCRCGGESQVGAHGIRDREVYSEYWCEKCFASKDKEVSKRVLMGDVRPEFAPDGAVWVGEHEWFKREGGEWKRIFGGERT